MRPSGSGPAPSEPGPALPPSGFGYGASGPAGAAAAPPAWAPPPLGLEPTFGQPPPRSRRTGLWIAAGVGVAAVIVVAVLLILAGTFRPAASTSVTNGVVGTPILYSAAVGAARTAQSSAQDGPWTLYALEGIGTDQGVSGSGSAGGFGLAGCTTDWASSASFAAPATPSNATAGAVGFWFAVSVNASSAVLIAIVYELPGGSLTAEPMAIVTGVCVGTETEFGAIPSSAVDSSVAVGVANANGGSSFLAGHSGVSQVLLQAGPYWIVGYTTCGVYATSGSGLYWADELYATNGTEILGGSAVSEAC